MSRLHSYLSQLGLTPTEATIYLLGLAHAEIDVRTLVRETGIKRPTVYHALEALIQKGLAAKRGSAQRLVFSMVPPERLEQLIDQQLAELTIRKKEFADILPLLQKEEKVSKRSEIQVAKYEGLSGVKAVVEEALYCKDRRWEIIAPRKNFFSQVDAAYAHYYLQTRMERGIISRSLWERTVTAIERPLSVADINQRNPRYLPASLRGRFDSVMILFDDKVALIASHASLSAILIHSGEVHRFMSVLFEGIWEHAEPYTMPTKKSANA